MPEKSTAEELQSTAQNNSRTENLVKSGTAVSEAKEPFEFGKCTVSLNLTLLPCFGNEASRKVFAARSKIVQSIRETMTADGYLEVETPMMQPIAGGALARPFVTHHNTLDMPLYLRIAPELYLKRLTVGGLERVFEINRNFRNEGISTEHNPEFTMMEFYEAYSDYQALMTMTEELVADVSRQSIGTDQITFGDHRISLAPPFARLSLRDAARDAASGKLGRFITDEDLRNQAAVTSLARQLGVDIEPGESAGKITCWASAWA